MPDAPQLLFPQEAPDPRRSLLRRLGIASGIVMVIALLAWIGRDGYSDADGSPLSLLDAIYYATVTVTTTGYGDIAPISPSARAVTAFVVTPLRVVFLVVLVGTTLELLTERFRRARAEARWRKTVRDHTIVAGYGTMGHRAVETLLANGDRADHVVVIDPGDGAVVSAKEAGLTAIMADATRTATWQQARIEAARAIVVTVSRDDTATLTTLTARALNNTVPISAACASRVRPPAPPVRGDDCRRRRGRRSPRDLAGRGIPIALVRGATHISFGDPAFQHVERDDIVVSVADVSNLDLANPD